MEWIKVEVTLTCRRCRRTATETASIAPALAAAEGGLDGTRLVLDGRALNRIERFECIPWAVRLDPPQLPAELPERYHALWQETEGWKHPPTYVYERRHDVAFEDRH